MYFVRNDYVPNVIVVQIIVPKLITDLNDVSYGADRT